MSDATLPDPLRELGYQQCQQCAWWVWQLDPNGHCDICTLALVYDLTEQRERPRQEVEGPWIAIRRDPGPCPGCDWCDPPDDPWYPGKAS